jgi:transposase
MSVSEWAVVDQEALVEYRYRAVWEVLGGSPIGEVAVRYGTTRQSLNTWRTRFKQEGMAGLADRSRRPHTSPTKLDADIEALICRMRREHPRIRKPSSTNASTNLASAKHRCICGSSTSSAGSHQLITQRSQVRILSPLLTKTAPGEPSGGRFHARWTRVWTH